MATRGAPLGNKNGSKGKPWREALRMELIQYESSEVPRGLVLRKIAVKVIEAALGGDLGAVQEIANRMDGKATENIQHEIATSARKLSDDELSRIITSGLRGGIDGEAQGEGEPAGLH